MKILNDLPFNRALLGVAWLEIDGTRYIDMSNCAYNTISRYHSPKKSTFKIITRSMPNYLFLITFVTEYTKI